MSVNYASGLSPYEHKGKCGMQELFDPPDVVEEMALKLAILIKNSKNLVVITGAGLSTSAGIPDFRGPSGVWTLEEKGETLETKVTFENAIPTYSHLALVTLEKEGYIKHLISQNVDGLHIRSGFPMNRISELHGNIFIEECDTCKAQYIRIHPVKTMARNYTGNSCTVSKLRGFCRGRLRDTILDWEDELQIKELNKSEDFCRKSDLCLCLGTSLQIIPCGNMPILTKKAGGVLTIVNLQKTKHYKKADIFIHSYIDVVMKKVCECLNLSLPTWNGPIIITDSQNDSNKNNKNIYVIDSLYLHNKDQTLNTEIEKVKVKKKTNTINEINLL